MKSARFVGTGHTSSVKRDQPEDDVLVRFGLDRPGISLALFDIAKMRRWGVVVTEEIARACIADHIRAAERFRLEAARRALLVSERGELVYYMLLGSRVKIGYTSNLPRRMQAINPEELLALEPGDLKLEKARHQQFTHLREHGEWFRYEEPLIGFIAALRHEMEQPLVGSINQAIHLYRRLTGVEVTQGAIRQWAVRGYVRTEKAANNKTMYLLDDIQRHAERQNLTSVTPSVT